MTADEIKSIKDKGAHEATLDAIHTIMWSAKGAAETATYENCKHFPAMIQKVRECCDNAEQLFKSL